MKHALLPLLQCFGRVATLDMGERKTVDALGFAAYNEAFARAYAKLVDGDTIICAHTHKEIKPISAPDAVVMDVNVSSSFSSGLR